MSRMFLVRLAGLFVLGVVVSSQAQSAPPPLPTAGGGIYLVSSVGVAHSSDAGWSSAMNWAVGYDVSENFGLEAGIPFYALTSTQRVTTGGTTQSTHYESLGDAYLTLKTGKDFGAIDYTTTLTGTVPTGDTSAGVSTGRATFTWNNHFEREFHSFTPFAEGSLGNSLASTQNYRRAFTTLGMVSEFQGGVALKLAKRAGLEGFAYDDVGYGDQKVYSQRVAKGAAGVGTPGKTHRPFDLAYLTQGSAGLAADHGLATVLTVLPSPRVGVQFGYNRSLHYATDTVSFAVAYRWGHVRGPQK